VLDTPSDYSHYLLFGPLYHCPDNQHFFSQQSVDPEDDDAEDEDDEDDGDDGEK
jgi:hypothetical protein